MGDNSKHSAHFEKDQKILSTASRFSIPHGNSKKEAWEKLFLEIDEVPLGKTRLMIPFLRAAASVLILTFAGLGLYQTQQIVIITSNAEYQMVYLPDSSSVYMNADSRLSYNSLLWARNRQINFEGEGLFDIRKSKGSFDISSPNGHTKVLGTRFNLTSRNEIYKVACVSGKVHVTSGTAINNAILTKGLSTERKGSAQILTAPAPFNEKMVTSWQSGEFYFENNNLVEVIAELERQYDIVVSLNLTNTNRMYTGYFNNTDLDEALKLVCIPLGLKYDVRPDDKVMITEELNV